MNINKILYCIKIECVKIFLQFHITYMYTDQYANGQHGNIYYIKKSFIIKIITYQKEPHF